MWFCVKALSECAAVLTLDPDQTAHLNVQSCYLCVLLPMCLALQIYMHQLAETQGVALLPPAVIRTLSAKACRSAIMFGDPLLPTECAQLVSSLKATQLCFSCAHGRPTMAPLVDLQALHNQVAIKGSASLCIRVRGDDDIGLKQKLRRLLDT